MPRIDRFAIAAHAASLGVWDWDLKTNTFDYSARAREMCGFALDQLLTYDDIARVTHPADLPRTSALAQRALDPAIREKTPYRYRIVRADNGQVRWMLAHGEAVFDPENPLAPAVHYIGTLQDITDQHEAEQQLIESESRLRLAVEAGRMAVWELDLERNHLTPSPELNVLFGFSANAHPSVEEINDRYAPGERERLASEGAEITARGETEIQTTIKQIWPDNSEHWFLLRAKLAAPTEAIARRVIGVVIDITAQKLAEERAELIAREMQHRVKNVLTVAQSLAMQTLGRVPATAAAAQAFVGRLRALSAATQSVSANHEVIDLGSLIEGVIEPYRQGDPPGFQLEGPIVLLPQAKATGLAMCLHELCTNAVKYGALSVPDGKIKIDWQVESNKVQLIWTEIGGPEVRTSGKGFGTTLLRRGALGAGSVDLSMPPSGVICTIRLELHS